MISFLLKSIDLLSQLLHRAAEKQQKLTEAKLQAASALVTQANGHRAAAQFARKVATGLQDIKQ